MADNQITIEVGRVRAVLRSPTIGDRNTRRRYMTPLVASGIAAEDALEAAQVWASLVSCEGLDWQKPGPHDPDAEIVTAYEAWMALPIDVGDALAVGLMRLRRSANDETLAPELLPEDADPLE